MLEIKRYNFEILQCLKYLNNRICKVFGAHRGIAPLKMSLKRAVVVHTSNHSTQETEAGELQDSQGYTKKLHSKKKKKQKQINFNIRH